MNNAEILDAIAVYSTAIIILLLLIVTVIFRIIRTKLKKKRDQLAVSEEPEVTTEPVIYHPDLPGTMDSMLPSLSTDTGINRKTGVIKKIEMMGPLKRGIMWAEILGYPGGRRRKNT